MYEVRQIENVVYDTEIGNAGLLDIYLPQMPNNAKTPVLVYFHGGGLESGDKCDDRNLYLELASKGLVVVSANYRMYPHVGFPVFIEDAAKAVSYTISHIQEYTSYDSIWIGGISAGGYLSMMLHFAPSYLSSYGVQEDKIAGYIFDAGQPTVHFNVLRERGIDTGAVRIDEAAPLYYLSNPYQANTSQRFLIISAEKDIPGRKEQNELLLRTMETHGYQKEQIEYRIMPDFTHAAYVSAHDEQGHYPYTDILLHFIRTE